MIWLVAIAVPMQGMAAITLLHCGPGHHGAQAAQRHVQALPDVREAAPGDHAAHGHVGQHAPDPGKVGEPGQRATTPDAAETARPGQVNDPVKVAKTTTQKCSACASCCAGLALPSTAVMPPTIDPAREISTLVPYRAVSYFVDGPERPPRILRA